MEMTERLKYVPFIICLGFILLILFTRCRLEVPVTATLTIDTENAGMPVTPGLYGVSLEEINHAIDGGLYAELIQNRSFEDGVAPPNCRIDAGSRRFVTPNGLTVAYCGDDSIPGWLPLSGGSRIAPDAQELINDKNKRSLRVTVYDTGTHGRGGAVAEGYRGIPVKKGAKYFFSCFIKNAGNRAGPLQIALERAGTGARVSDVYSVSPLPEWQRLHYTFLATADVPDARLVFSSDTVTAFWLDVVSLFSEDTWKKQRNGLRADLVEKIAALQPSFIRFPGGSFAEGYSAGTYPEWKTTIGDIAVRRHFWSFWGYGTTNGMGFHEYLQLCEDLVAEPVYVVNCGITSQSRRPRYQDIVEMDGLVQDVLDALEYANGPATSGWGAVRKANGHPEPFGLKYIQIGNENSGYEYARRYACFEKTLRERYPEVTLIATDEVPGGNPDRVDRHFFAGTDWLMSHTPFSGTSDSLPELRDVRPAPLHIGAFSAVPPDGKATLRNAVAEACFLIEAEQAPDRVRQIAYAPLLARTDYADWLPAALCFDNEHVVETPSYLMWRLFAGNRGDEVLPTGVTCYTKPSVTAGRAGIYLFDDFYEFDALALDGSTDYLTETVSGEWTVQPGGRLYPAPNRWNSILLGDSSAYNYELTARFRRVKGSAPFQFRLRDTGRSGRERNYLFITLGSGDSRLGQQSGEVTSWLSGPASFPWEMNEWYAVRIVCKNDTVACYVNDTLLHRAVLPPVPALKAVTARDRETGTLILKVVNTAYHPERTRIDLGKAAVRGETEAITLTGKPDAGNTPEHPRRVYPERKTVVFPSGSSFLYEFPPNSVTVLKIPTR